MTEAPTPGELIARAQVASAALDAAREHMRTAKTRDAALIYCKAFQTAREARAVLPKLRLVQP